jgi:hypothetical protein
MDPIEWRILFRAPHDPNSGCNHLGVTTYHARVRNRGGKESSDTLDRRPPRGPRRLVRAGQGASAGFLLLTWTAADLRRSSDQLSDRLPAGSKAARPDRHGSAPRAAGRRDGDPSSPARSPPVLLDRLSAEPQVGPLEVVGQCAKVGVVVSARGANSGPPRPDSGEWEIKNGRSGRRQSCCQRARSG